MNEVLMRIRQKYGCTTIEAERILRERGELITVATAENVIAGIVVIGTVVICIVSALVWAYLKQRVVGYRIVR